MNAPLRPAPGGADDPLRIWTVYDHPTDYPNNYVARLYIVVRGEALVSETDFVVSPQLDPLRELLQGWGLICIGRRPEDDPKIVESWL